VTEVAVRPRVPSVSLATRRAAVLARIHIAREESASIGVRLAADMDAAEKTRRSMVAGLQVLKASVVAAGVIWSFNSATKVKGARRVFTIILSLLSTVRGLRKLQILGKSGVLPTHRAHIAQSHG
jgi:hypothetical protein